MKQIFKKYVNLAKIKLMRLGHLPEKFVLAIGIVSLLGNSGIASLAQIPVVQDTAEPVVESVSVVGSAQPTIFSPDNYHFRIENRIVTAYSSTPDQTDDTPFETAIGSRVRPGVVAANWLPIGALVRFPDYDPDTWYQVEDRMNTRFSHRTDIWMEDRDSARKFGIKTLEIEIATVSKK